MNELWNYDWIAGLVLLATTIVVTRAGTALAFLSPSLQRMRELNREKDTPKRARARFKKVSKQNAQIGGAMNAVFFFVAAPFVVDLEGRAIWRGLFDVVAMLLIFDFFYYLTHRFVFHGELLKKVHALHHEARKPSHSDAFYVHPLETAIGLVLFMGSALGYAATTGGVHALSMMGATVLFTQINTINHTYVDLPYFPFRTLDYITTKHHRHHENMGKGNYATLTMAYDYVFGTLE